MASEQRLDRRFGAGAVGIAAGKVEMRIAGEPRHQPLIGFADVTRQRVAARGLLALEIVPREVIRNAVREGRKRNTREEPGK